MYYYFAMLLAYIVQVFCVKNNIHIAYDKFRSFVWNS